MEAFPCLFVCLLAAGVIAAAIVLIRWVAGPVEALARGRRLRAQFTTGDLLSLFVMLQFPTGLIHFLLRDDPSPTRWILDGYAAFALALIWWYGVRTLSAAGITTWWHRAVFLVFVVPCGTFGSATMPMAAAGALVAAFEQSAAAAILAGVAAGLLALVFACGMVTRWIVAKSSLPSP